MASRFFVLCVGLLLLGAPRSNAADPTYVDFNTSEGHIVVELFPLSSPQNVANFLAYVDAGAYTNSIIHRSIPGFVEQGGGYYVANNTLPLNAIPTNAAVVGEHVASNVRGTLALALSNGPDTGTDQWFFNLVDNSSVLDGTADGGPFTVFGAVTNPAGLAVMDSLTTIPIYNAGSPFDNIPLLNYDNTVAVAAQNLVYVVSITRVTIPDVDMPTFLTSKLSSAQQADPNFTSPTGIPWSDHVPNLLKYLFDIDPSRPMNARDRASLPIVGTVTKTVNSVTTNYLTLTYRQYAQMTGVTVSVQTSSNMNTWSPAVNPTTVQTGVDSTTATGDPILQVQVPITTNQQFIRLNVTQ